MLNTVWANVDSEAKTIDVSLREDTGETWRWLVEDTDRRTLPLTNWFANGMSEYEVMRLSGHTSFTTTHQFYLAVADDLIDRSRTAASTGIGQDLVRDWRTPTVLGKGD